MRDGSSLDEKSKTKEKKIFKGRDWEMASLLMKSPKQRRKKKIERRD
jgi:hypothetical protein